MANLPTLIADRDHIVAAAGVPKREYLERRITASVEDLIEARKSFNSAADGYMQPVEGLERGAGIIFPIIAAGDVTGAVIMLQNERKANPTEVEIKLAQTAAAFLGKQMEE